MVDYNKLAEKLTENFLLGKINYNKFEKVGRYLEKRANKKLWGVK